MITEFKTIPKAVYYVQTADGCTVLDPDGDTLAEITAPGGYFPGIAAADGGPGTVTFSAPVKRVVGPFDLAPQLQLNLLGQLGGTGGLPAGFKRVEYLESDGGQYIEVPELINFPFLVTCEAQWISTPINGNSYLWGFLNGTASSFIGRAGVFISSAVGGINYPAFGFAAACFADYRYVLYSGEERAVYTLERQSLQTSPTALINGRLPIGPLYISNDARYTPTTAYLFARKVNEKPSDNSIARIWRFKIETNSAIVCDLIPCLHPTGAPCMFDLVTRRALYNSGSGDFTYPTATATYSRRRVLPDWGKLTENGLRRLYNAPANYTGELYDYALEHGYKPIVEPEKPEEGYWSPVWRETDEEIVLEWVETDPPMDDYLTQPTE